MITVVRQCNYDDNYDEKRWWAHLVGRLLVALLTIVGVMALFALAIVLALRLWWRLTAG
jgi:hypothetical protein